jgi:hypothetical protein
MYFEDHCKDCLNELGDEHQEVHLFLDQFFVKMGPKHRSVYHCVEGLEEVRENFGEEGVEAAKIHILKDFEGDFDYIPTRLEVEKWYKQIYLGVEDNRIP